jgi:hypothetical protein
MRPTLPCLFSALAIAAAAATASAQTATETQARVPELIAFHEVIYPMWHTAWPARDTTLLRELWPDIQKHIAAVEQAELPGILRDKQEAWDKGLARLKAAEARYGKALDGGTVDDKLAAAEEMHSAYEGLVRAIRPVMPELAQFHSVLYRIYHYYLPQKDQPAMVAVLPELAAEMDTLSRAVLPKRFADQKQAFDKARAELSKGVKEVVKVTPQADWAKTGKAVERMHTAYQAVERVFD